MHSLGQVESLLDLAQKVLKSIVSIMEKEKGALRVVERDLRRDVKITADRRIETLIIDHLTKESEFPILSEEKGIIARTEDIHPYHWIIDPLDGSLNFSRSLPFSCISIAFWKEMEPLLGVVYDFIHDETFTGIVGKGAWLNGRPIRISGVKDLSSAVLCTGFPVDTDFEATTLMEFVKSIQTFKKVRLFGSAALSLAYVSCGRADFYLENDIKIWDVAAGLALVKAAGGEIRVKKTTKENNLRVQATNNSLHFI